MSTRVLTSPVAAPEPSALRDGATEVARMRRDTPQMFVSSLLFAAPVVFQLAAGLTLVVVALSVNPEQQVPQWVPRPDLVAFLVPVVVWLVLGLGFMLLGVTRSDRANESSYGLLRNRLDQLTMCRDWYQRLRLSRETILPAADDETLAFGQFSAHVAAIREELNREGTQWVSGNAYSQCWQRVHRADELWLSLAPWSAVVASADSARRSLSGSDIDRVNANDMAESIKNAFAALHEDSVLADAAQRQKDARARLAEAWHSIHEFRDQRWHGLLNARNQLMLAMGLAGLVQYMLLWLAVLALPFSAWSMIIGAAALFIVGAVVGLFNRLHALSQETKIADDYGLTTAQLVLTPQLSGLAALLGVVLAYVVSVGLGQSANLQDAFNITTTPNLLLAAVFGLTPSLVIDQIKNREKILKEVTSTSPTESSS